MAGGTGNDNLEGGAGNDLLRGDDGNDVVRGGEGDDTVEGGAGNDRLFGDAGNDQMAGGNGNDAMTGGIGNDVLRGEAGADTLLGGDGADFLWGGDGNDSSGGRLGNDTIRSGAGDDRLQGNEGDDMLGGAAGRDMVLGADGNDTLWGGGGDDHQQAGNGNDLVVGGLGSDLLAGCYGADFLLSRSDAGELETHCLDELCSGTAMTGNDTLVGGPGPDTFRFELTLDAGSDVIARHLNPDGTIDWQGVATMENAGEHDHWMEGIGSDTIRDYSRSDGDRIEIIGHKTEIASIAYADVDGNGSLESVITLRTTTTGSAHDANPLGTITVMGTRVMLSDINLRTDLYIGAYARPGDDRQDDFGILPVDYTGPSDWVLQA